MLQSTQLARLLAVSGLVLMFATGCDDRPAGPRLGKTLFGYCVQCHGEDGAGKPEFATPAIAGLADWYVEAQLLKFRSGLRGGHADDTAGLRMRPMSKTLSSDEEVKAVAGYVASLPGVLPEPTLEGGDATRGATRFMLCIACHGPDGKGKRELNSPNLTRANDWYLFEQIEKFKLGIRGADPGDITGAQMRPMALSLTDDQAIKDVIAHIRTLK